MNNGLDWRDGSGKSSEVLVCSFRAPILVPSTHIRYLLVPAPGDQFPLLVFKGTTYTWHTFIQTHKNLFSRRKLGVNMT